MFPRKVSLLILIGILFIASFLRFFRIEQNLVFHGELGFDYLAIRNIIQGKQTPLLGPPTSHQWLFISPLFYWIFAIVLPLGNYHPIVGAYFFAALGVLAVILAYFVVKEFLGKEAGLISAYLLTISPAWVELTRNSRFNFFIPLLFFPFIYFLVKSLSRKRLPAGRQGKNFFWLGAIVGLSYSFFPSILIWLPAALLIIYLKRKNVRGKALLWGLAGLIIPNIAFIIYNALNKFEIIIKLAAWIPYRILGFFGLYPKNTANLAIIKTNFISLYAFFREAWFPKETQLAVLLFLFVIGFFIIKTASEIFNKKSNFWLTFSVVFIITYAGLFLHGDPPSHYYYIMFPVPIILVSQFLVSLSKRKSGIIISSLILILITIQSFMFYFSKEWFYQPLDKTVIGYLPVPYHLQERVVSLIKDDAKGRKFELRRVGPLDHFDEDFAQNYIYLLWRAGNEPVEEAGVTYTIYEDTTRLPENLQKEVFWVGNIAVLKEKNAF